MKSLFLLIKPASEKCNMDCSYCFYHDISSKRETKDYGFMQTAVSHKVIDRAFDEDISHITFGFQGGEPTLIGLPFFEDFISYVKVKQATKKISVAYNLQTNGTLITDQFADFFVSNNFLIGLSLDGSRKLNDKHRILRSGDSTYDDVLKTVKLFQVKKVAFNILVVVTHFHIGQEKQIYNFFKKNNLKHLQFIPCLDPVDEERGKKMWSLTPDDYLTFLNAIFSLWTKDINKSSAPNIRYFSDVLDMVAGNTPASCDRRGICSIQNIIEADGQVYPCDFYVFEKLSLGNLETDSFKQMSQSSVAQKFIANSLKVHPDCQVCPYFKLCRGGCFRNRIDVGGTQKNYYCHAYYNFFKTNIKQLELLTYQLKYQKH